MIPVETTQELGDGEIKEMVEEVNSCMIYLMHCENLCNNVPPPITTIKGENDALGEIIRNRSLAVIRVFPED
jgi:hypothetical protein